MLNVERHNHTFNIQHSTFNIQHSTFSAARLAALLFLPDLRLLRVADPLAPGETADAGEGEVGDAGGRVLLRVDLQLRLAAIAEVGVAALNVLHEAFHL